MTVLEILDEVQVGYLKALLKLFLYMGQWDIEKPGLRFINDLAERRSLFPPEEADSFTKSFVILVRNAYDFPDWMFEYGPSWLLKVSSGKSDATGEIFWSGTSEDIETLRRLSVAALGVDLTTRTCELLSSSQGWSLAEHRRYKESQRHIEYFAENPVDTIAMFSMAWHGDLSPTVRTLCERFTAFANAQEPTKRLAIMDGIEILLDHRAYSIRFISQMSMDRLEKKERALKDANRILQAVELLCQSAVYREYMEKLSKSKGDKAGEIWKNYWEGQVDTAAAVKEGPVWRLLETFGHPTQASAVVKVKGLGTYLWGRLSQPIHSPNLQAVEDRFNTPLDHWRKDERDVLLVIKEMAHEEVPDKMPEWEKSTNWRS